MTSVLVPATVESIDLAFFQLLPNAAAITVAEGNSVYSSNNGMLLDAAQTSLLLVPEGMEGDAVLPANMASVPACVFSRCTKLSAISVDTAGSAATSAFASQDGILYNGDKTTLVAAPAGLGASAVVAPECQKIAEGAFSGNQALVTIVAPGQVMQVSGTAFEEAVVAAATVATPSAEAWEAAGFTRFAEVAQPGMAAQPDDPDGFIYTLQDDYTLAVAWAGGDVPADLRIPDAAMLGGVSYPVTAVAAEGFSGTAVEELALPDSVLTIGEGAFAGCAGLVDAGLARVQAIEARAFSGTSLKNIVLPATVEAIGDAAFDGLNGTPLVALGTVKDVAASALGGSTGIDIYVPYSESEAYAWTTGLPTAGNHLYPYGVKLDHGALNLQAGETANLFEAPGYLHAPGDIKVIYSYSAKTVSVDTATGDITAKRNGAVNVDVSIELPMAEQAWVSKRRSAI